MASHRFASRSFSLTGSTLPSQPSYYQGNMGENYLQSNVSHWDRHHRSSYPLPSSQSSATSISRPQQWTVPPPPQQGYPLPPCLFRRPSGASSTEDGNSRRPSMENTVGLSDFLGLHCLSSTKESEECGNEATQSNTDDTDTWSAARIDRELSPVMDSAEERIDMQCDYPPRMPSTCEIEVEQSEVAVALQQRSPSPRHPVFLPRRNSPCAHDNSMESITPAARYENSSPISYSSGGWKGGYGQGSPSFNMIATANPAGQRNPSPLRVTLLPGLPRRDTFGSVNVDEQKRPSHPFISAAIGQDSEECERTVTGEGDNEPKPQPFPESSEYIIPNRRESHLRTEKPSYAKSATKMEVDLADILDGTRKLPELVASQYEITGCITVSSYGFILAANRCCSNWTNGAKKKPVSERERTTLYHFIRCTSRSWLDIRMRIVP